MTAVYPYYKLADEEMGVKGGFIYEEVPHITLKSIAQNEPAQNEILFDKPEVDRKRIRVAGPFTVEGIPQNSTLDFEDANYEAEAKAVEKIRGGRVEAENHIHTLIELFRKDSVTFPSNKKMRFNNLIPVHIMFIHAEGEPAEKNGVKKVAVSFGPQHGPVTVWQVQDGINDAYLKGVDIYDPLTGEVYPDNGSKIAAWFIDTDYDKRTFCISQAFSPDSTAWDKLKRALKASIDEDKFELLTSSRSLPFKLGKENRIAVKVIDHRGNEVMVVREMR